MESLAKKYPKYYKSLPAGVSPDEVDVYVINMMFPLDDKSGTLEHARKKLLIPGTRSGGKSMLKDIIEARDTLNRYIALHEHTEGVPPLRDEETVRREVFAGEPTVYGVSSPAEIGTVVEGGWIVHGGDLMPEPLSDEQLVEVRMKDGQEYTGNFAKPAKDWLWSTSGDVRPISHYRLLRFDTGSPVAGELDHNKELVDEPGWYQHDGGPRPAGIAQRDMVKVRLSNGHEVAVPREGYKWNWEYRQDSPTAAPHIEAWRFA